MPFLTILVLIEMFAKDLIADAFDAWASPPPPPPSIEKKEELVANNGLQNAVQTMNDFGLCYDG